MTHQVLPWDRCDWPGLLDAARSGVEGALAEVFARLDSYCRMIAGNSHSAVLAPKFGASDIAQKSLLEAYTQFSTFEGRSEAELRAWLASIVHHNAIDAARHYLHAERRSLAREQRLDQPATAQIVGKSQPPSLALRQRETDLELAHAVARLPESQQTVLELRYRDGLDHQAIAARLGISEPAARKQCSRAIETLRRQLAAGHGTGI